MLLACGGVWYCVEMFVFSFLRRGCRGGREEYGEGGKEVYF